MDKEHIYTCAGGENRVSQDRRQESKEFKPLTTRAPHSSNWWLTNKLTVSLSFSTKSSQALDKSSQWNETFQTNSTRSGSSAYFRLPFLRDDLRIIVWAFPPLKVMLKPPMDVSGVYGLPGSRLRADDKLTNDKLLNMLWWVDQLAKNTQTSHFLWVTLLQHPICS